MDDKLKFPLSLSEAKETLRQQWAEGNPKLEQLARRLTESDIRSLEELVLLDAQESLRTGSETPFEDYLERFPQLETNRDELKAKFLALKQNYSSSSQSLYGSDALDLFSKQSFPPTQVFESDRLKDQERTRRPATDSQQEPSYPAEIGNFRIDRFIGRGSFGIVLQGTDKRLGRKVALKVKDGSKDRSLSDDFLHEARSISKLDHPNIVRLLQADETPEGVGYLVYEFVDGEMLDERVKRNDYTVEECVEWISTIADALDYAHRRGIIHRDISPRNIMITSDGTAKLLDFGLSSIDEEFHTDVSNCVLGTLLFISPELASGKPHWATSHADIFSLGSVLYYALTQKPPFPGAMAFDICERIQKASPAPPRSICDNIPVRLEEACLRALAKEPQMRFSTGADMSAALINSLTFVDEVKPSKSSPTTAYIALALGLAISFIGIAAVAFGLLGNDPKSNSKLPKIRDFDVKVVQSNLGSQVSLPFVNSSSKGGSNDEENSKLFSKVGLSLSEKPSLIVNATADDSVVRRLYCFHFDISSGVEPTGKWSSPIKMIENDTRKTIQSPDDIHIGPNVLLLVCAKNESSFIDLNKIRPPLNIKLDNSLSSMATSSNTNEGGKLGKVLLFHSTHFEFGDRNRRDDVQLQSISQDELDGLRQVWTAASVSDEFKEALSKAGLAYCGIAFFVNR